LPTLARPARQASERDACLAVAAGETQAATAGTRGPPGSSLSCDMFGLLALIGLMIAGFAVAAVIGTMFLVLKIVLWVVLFPFRLLFKILMIPIWMTLGAIGMLAGVALIPIVLMVVLGIAILGVIAAVLALLLPALPFVLFGLLIWALMRRRPVAA
jgi:hypothetical protein